MPRYLFCIKLVVLLCLSLRIAAQPRDLTPDELNYLAEKKQILMCIDPKWMPYEGIDIAGQHRGISADYIELVAERIATPIKLHPTTSWRETLKSAENRSCDIISMARATEARKAFLNFTTPYVSFPYVVASLFQKHHISSMADNLDKTYAVVKGYAINEYLLKRYPSINILPVKNIDDGLEKLRSGAAYGYLDSLLTLGYYIRQNGALDIKVTARTDFSSSVSIASRNDEPLLNSVLQKALDSISEQEKQNIMDRWVSIQLEEQRADQIELGLTPEEQSFLNRKTRISVCVDPDRMPHEGLRDGEHTGIGGDMMTLLAQRSGLDISVLPTRNWQESLTRFRKRDCDLLSMIDRTPDRERQMQFTRPYLRAHSVFVAPENQSYIADPKEISGKTVATVAGYSVTEFLKRDFPEATVIEVDNYQRAFEVTAKGSSHLTVDYLLTSGSRIQELGLHELKIAGSTPYTHHLRIGVQKGQEELLGILNKTLASLPSHEVEAIINQWRTVRFQQEVDNTILWRVVLIASCIIGLSFFWTRRLHQAKERTQDALTKLANVQAQLEKQAITDSLTNLFNRSKLDETLDQELQRAKRFNHSFGIVLMDIDHFKQVNDTFGHPVGDQVLRDIAGILQAHTRDTDTVGRWGGEEFMILCPESELDHARQLAEKLRAQIEMTTFPEANKKTASFGVTSYRQGDSVASLVARADANLYRAKNQGRNQVQAL